MTALLGGITSKPKHSTEVSAIWQERTFQRIHCPPPPPLPNNYQVSCYLGGRRSRISWWRRSGPSCSRGRCRLRAVSALASTAPSWSAGTSLCGRYPTHTWKQINSITILLHRPQVRVCAVVIQLTPGNKSTVLQYYFIVRRYESVRSLSNSHLETNQQYYNITSSSAGTSLCGRYPTHTWKQNNSITILLHRPQVWVCAVVIQLTPGNKSTVLQYYFIVRRYESVRSWSNSHL